jgi:hypothetical protein
MDTATKNAQKERSTDRLMQALSTLAALLDRTINEVKSLEPDFQKRLSEALQDTEATLHNQAAEHLEKTLASAELRVREEATAGLKALYEVDLKAALAALRTEMEEEFRKKTAEMSIQVEAERRRLIAEADRANQAASQALAARQAAEQALAKKMKASPAPAAVDSAAMMKEIEKVENVIRQISTLIDDPGTELSTVIRKNVERAELESYLKGIRFALGK